MRLRPDLSSTVAGTPHGVARPKDNAREPAERTSNVAADVHAQTTFQGSHAGLTDLTSAQLTDKNAPSAGPSSVFAQRLKGAHALPILPLAGVPYSVSVERMGKQLSFDVTFTPRACSEMLAHGLRAELERGRIVGGEAPIVLGDGEALAARQGGEHRPWVFLDTVSDTFFVPTDGVCVDSSGAGNLHWTPKGCTPLLFDVLRDELARADGGPMRTPRGPALLAAEHFTVTEPLGEGITLRATNMEVVASAQRAFDAVCGRAMERWPARRRGLEERVKEFGSAIRPLLEVCMALEDGAPLPAHADATLARARALAELDDTHAPIDLVHALQALRERLKDQLMPVEVVVVPRGSHYLDMPQLDSLRGLESWRGLEEKLAISELAMVSVHGTRVVFLSEEDLASGTQGCSRHELYHLLESALLEDDVVARVDAIHARLTEQGGPFSRRYGAPRGEFFTTCGEELEGLWGADGVPWLHDNIPDMLALLRDVTGRG